MPDVTLHVMRVVATHTLPPNSLKKASRYKIGDIIGASLTTSLATWNVPLDKYEFDDVISSPRLAFIHCVGVPSRVAEKMQEYLQQPIQNNDGELVRRVKYRFPPSVMPQGVKDTLNADKEITGDWSTIRNFIRRKVVVSNTDETQDTEADTPTDAEIGAERILVGSFNEGMTGEAGTVTVDTP